MFIVEVALPNGQKRFFGPFVDKECCKVKVDGVKTIRILENPKADLQWFDLEFSVEPTASLNAQVIQTLSGNLQLKNDIIPKGTMVSTLHSPRYKYVQALGKWYRYE